MPSTSKQASPSSAPGELKLLAHQESGIEYIKEHRRVLLADDPGTGKTMIALKTIEAEIDETKRPGLIVCKASLRPNFEDEASAWLPGLDVQVLTNKTEIRKEADLHICGFETMTAKAEELRGAGHGIVWVDESHYLKNPKAARTVAAKAIVEPLNRDAVIVCASATPGVSRPRELASQLSLLGRLDRIVANEHKFLMRYCGPTKRWNPQLGRKVWDFSGYSNLSELRGKLLEENVLLRRRKADVLELPSRTFVEIEVSPEGPKWDEYFEAQSDFMAYLTKSNGGERPKVTPEAIEHLTALRRMAGAAKVRKMADKAAEFVSSGRSLVIMVHHRDSVAGLVEGLEQSQIEPTSILGGQSDAKRRKAMKSFQSGRVPVIVCSLEAAAEGLTMTKAADLWFGELPFTPGRFDQAADRVHRVGQTRDVTVGTFLAPGTIDARIYSALRRKRKILAELFDGEVPEFDGSKSAEEQQSILSMLMGWYGENNATLPHNVPV